MTYKERLLIRLMLDDEMKATQIAKDLGVHPATIYREYRKGYDEETGRYEPDLAQSKYESNLKRRGKQLL